MKDYNPNEIEPKWQKIWDEKKVYKTPKDEEGIKKKYVLDMFPYPSGAGLHVGHPEGYTASDIYARYLRANGYSVLHPMGWDAFGLPAENYAIKTGVHPQKSTDENIATFKRQLKNLGFSYDWDREINTSKPDYYKWTQWLFLKLYEKGLAYRKKAPVNWCPGCNTVLANEQVVDGKCVRSGDKVIQKELEQWFFKITDYAQKLLDGLEKLDWSEPIKIMQRNWIGKSEGAQIKFRVKSSKSKVEDIEVFTTRPDTLFGATYLVIAPDHQQISSIKNQLSNWDEVQEYIQKTAKKTDLQRTDLNKNKTGVELKGITAINPVNNKEIPIWIADYVLSSYGTGAIMAVPAHDERDREFAIKFSLTIQHVVKSQKLKAESYNSKSLNDQVFTQSGNLVNSGSYTGMTSEEGGKKMVEDLEKKDLAEFKTQFKLRDWLISRQRYWGAPIPVIFCANCAKSSAKPKFQDTNSKQIQNSKFKITTIDGVEFAIIPIPEDQLPVTLPTDVDFKPTGESPLLNSKSFHSVNCPRCQSPARRESDTMDTFVDSSWYFLAFTVKDLSTFNFQLLTFGDRMPVDVYIGGAEHAVLHLLYARFITKVLKDMAILNADEPFTKLINQGLILAEDGKKMSKSLGNVINPDDVVGKYGADTLRMYEMFMGPLKDAKPWSTTGIIGIYRFLSRIWKYADKIEFSETNDLIIADQLEKIKIKVSNDIVNFSFNTAIAQLMIFINTITKIQITKREWSDFLIMLSLFAPHISEELWSRFNTSLVANEKWVQINKIISDPEESQIPVQINGKLVTLILININDHEEKIKKRIMENTQVQQKLAGKVPLKFIFIPRKIINIVV